MEGERENDCTPFKSSEECSEVALFHLVDIKELQDTDKIKGKTIICDFSFLT